MHSYKIYWEIYGCEMNKSQAHSLQAYLSSKGHQKASDIHEADFVFIYTCSVRSTAERRALGRLGYFKYIKQSANNLCGIVILGCLSEEYWEQFLNDDYADIIVGTKKQDEIETALDTFYVGHKKTVVGIKAVKSDEMNFLRSAPDELYPFRAYVSIIHGCSNYCSYCVVPYLRGAEISRKSDDILLDIENLVDLGVKELFLLGQNVNAYGHDTYDISFSRLLQKIASIKKLECISFLSSHPKDFSDELIDVIAENPVISRNIHLPLQSGSNKILKRMNRKYSIKDYMSIVEKLKKTVADIQLSTDIIVGFPDESYNDFMDTIFALKDVEYTDAFMYKYTKRKLVKPLLEETVSEEEKLSRLEEMIKIQSAIAIKIRKNQIAKTKKVIIITHSKKDDDKMLFRSHDGFFGVVKENKLPGTVCLVNIVDVIGKTLVGELV